MYFQLLKLILWPRDDGKPRIVEFTPGVVNVISGASKTGKSAVIPIIDYCLGAGKCAIPVGVIRQNCSWFGILINTIEGQKLLGRREPGDLKKTGDMILLEGPDLEVPHRIEGKTTNVDTVKAMLNRLSGLTALEFDPSSEGGFKARPSFRDLMAFTFQPQNIIANPDVLFFKADTTEHREKLKTIFPYVLGAVTPAIMAARYELDRLQRSLRVKQTELQSVMAATTNWQREAVTWLRQAKDFGLIDADQLFPEEWLDVIGLLRTVADTDPRQALPSIEGIDATLQRLADLRQQETDSATQLSEHRQRLNELRRLLESSAAYGSAIHMQRDRLDLSDWLLRFEENKDDAVAALTHSRENLLALSETLEDMELRLRSHPTISATLDKELIRQRGATELVLGSLNAIRNEISALERESASVREAAYRSDTIQRFLGRLEQALRLYDETDHSSGLRGEIAALTEKIDELRLTVREGDIKRRMQNALGEVEGEIGRLVPRSDAEWPKAPVRLAVDELSLKIVHDGRDDYLWEIGSGANWLAYHVTLTLALQKFFMLQPQHSVPALLIYDQPSQVYFPRRLARSDAEDTPALRDEDIDAVRKVFLILGDEVRASNSHLQVIVLDHASDDVWGDIEDVVLTEEWRGPHKLVPVDWLADGQK